MRWWSIAAAVLMAWGGSADAGSISYTAPLSSTTQPGFIPYFDPAIGMLTGLSITASGRVSQAIEPDVPDPEPYTATYQLTVVFPGFPFYRGPVTPAPSGHLGVIDDTFSFRSDTVTSPAALADFVGTGRYNLQVAAHFFVLITPHEGVSYQGVPFVEGTATVTYDYGLAPEPASAVPLSLGLAAVAGLAWRRRRVR